MDNHKYGIKVKMFKKLIAKSFPDYKITYFFDRESKKYYVIFDFGLRLCNLPIEPDINWGRHKEALEMMVSDPIFKDNKCHICFEEIHDAKAGLCSNCEINICLDCLSKVILHCGSTCPQCRSSLVVDNESYGALKIIRNDKTGEILKIIQNDDDGHCYYDREI